MYQTNWIIFANLKKTLFSKQIKVNEFHYLILRKKLFAYYFAMLDNFFATDSEYATIS